MIGPLVEELFLWLPLDVIIFFTSISFVLGHDNRVKFWNISYLEKMDYEKKRKPQIQVILFLLHRYIFNTSPLYVRSIAILTMLRTGSFFFEIRPDPFL